VSPLLFLALAALTIASALTVVVHRNPVHGACALVVTLFLLSVFFGGLDAQLVAALQVIVYAGAVVVLFLFVIMLLNLQAEERSTGGPVLIATASGAGIVLAALVVSMLRRSATTPVPGISAGYGQTQALSEKLFTSYLLPFELTSVLLLVAIVGAVALGRKRA
jgi:NADH-quinone oxidoreductase subunit J